MKHCPARTCHVGLVVTALLLAACAPTRESLRRDLIDALTEPDRREDAAGRLAELALLDGDSAHALTFASSKQSPPDGSAALAIGLAYDAEGQLAAAVDSWAAALAADAPSVRRAAALLLLDVADFVPSRTRPAIHAARARATGADAALLEALVRAVDRAPAAVPTASVRLAADPTPVSHFVDAHAGDSAPGAEAAEPLDAPPSPTARWAAGEIVLQNQGRSRYQADVQLPAGGPWWVRVTAPGPLELRAGDAALWRHDPTERAASPTRLVFVGEPSTVRVTGAASRPFARIGFELLAAPPGPDASLDPDGGWPAVLARLLLARWDGDTGGVEDATDALKALEPSFRIPVVLVGKAPRDATHAAAIRQRALAALTAGQTHEALRLAGTLLAVDDPRSALLAARVFRESSSDRAARDALARAAALAPEACEPAERQLENDFQRIKLALTPSAPLTVGPGAAVPLPSGCERAPGVRVLLAQLAAETGRLDDATTRLRQLIDDDGADPGTWLTVLERAGRLDQALGAGATVLGDRGTEPTALERWVDLHRLAGVSAVDGQPLDAVLSRAAALPRGDVEARIRLLARGVGRELFALAPSVEEALTAPLDPALIDGRSSVVLLDHATTLRFRDGTGLQHVRQVMRILDASAVEGMGEASVPESGVLLFAATHKPDGRVLEPEEIQGKSSISFPDLQVGDAIELEYLDPLTPDAFLGGGFIESAYFFNVFDVPVRESTYILLAQDGAQPVVLTRPELPAEPVSIPGFQGVRLRVGPSQGVVGELAASAPYDALTQARAVCLVSDTGCAASREAGLPLLREALLGLVALDAPTRALALRLARPDGEGGPQSDADQARAIWSYVVSTVAEDETAWLSTSAQEALTSKKGERAVVALALLWAAGLPAELVVAEPVDSGASALDASSPRVLMHRVVRVGDLWLDPDMGATEPGFLLPTVLGQPGFTVGRHAGHARVTLPSEEPRSSRREIVVDVTLGPDYSLTGTWSETARGVDAAAYRDVLGQVAKDEYRKRLTPFIDQVIPGVDVSESTVEGLTGAGPITARHVFHRDAGPGRDTLELHLIPIDIGSRWASLETRTSALVVELNALVDITVRVHLGGAALAGGVPADAETTLSPRAGYSRRVLATEDTVVVERHLTLRPQRVDAAAYPAFRSFAELVDASDVVSLSLTARP